VLRVSKPEVRGFHRRDRRKRRGKIEIGNLSVLCVLGGKTCGAVGRFSFLAAGLELGRTALSRESARSADLIVVDEFGPWELDGGGWRKNVDELLAAAPAASFLPSKTAGAVLLIVRDQLVGLVQKAYSHIPVITLPAGGPDSARRVIELLRSRRQTAHG
jgi:nucleoside-triphosphatase THEP1